MLVLCSGSWLGAAAAGGESNLDFTSNCTLDRILGNKLTPAITRGFEPTDGAQVKPDDGELNLIQVGFSDRAPGC